MKKTIYALAFLMLGAFGNLHADEGMWLPMFVERLNYVDMQKDGLQLTAEEIYSVNQSSLKDAIVGLSEGAKPGGYFCTAEVVSDQGLLFTNHHCGYDKIQNHSSLEHDYLTNGFWAMNKSEELPNEGLSVSFLIRMEDVTDSCLVNVSDTMTAEERSAEIRKVTTRLKKVASEDDRYHVIVKSFFEGNEYYLFVYEVFTDVRLVGAPPSAIGKFGGDTDNWMWPRHTGDFSIFRIYTAPDGKPANYAAENIPLKPRHHLPISLDGVKPGDFSMVWGYPGSTDRYLTSDGVDFNLEDEYPAIIDLFGKKLEVWKEFMDTDQKVKIQYASKYAVVANTWKYLIGQTRGLNRLGVSDKKRELENQFTTWVNADENRVKKYGNVLTDMKNGYTQMGESIAPLLYTSMAGSNGAEIIGFASDFAGLESAMSPIDKKDLPKDKEMARKMKEDKKAELEKTIQSLKESLPEQYKDYSAIADQKSARAARFHRVDYFKQRFQCAQPAEHAARPHGVADHLIDAVFARYLLFKPLMFKRTGSEQRDHVVCALHRLMQVSRGFNLRFNLKFFADLLRKYLRIFKPPGINVHQDDFTVAQSLTDQKIFNEVLGKNHSARPD